MDNKPYFFSIRTDQCVSFTHTFAYSSEAEVPLVVAHYNHEATLHEPYTSTESDRGYCSVFVSLSGNFSFIINDKIYSPSYGNVVFMREHEKYISCFHSATHMDYYEIAIPCDFFEKVPAAKKMRTLFYSRNPGEQNMISSNKIVESSLLKKLKAIENFPDDEFLVYSYLIQFFDILCTSFSQARVDDAANKIPLKLNDAINYIHSSFLTIENIKEVSDECNISTVYLSRIFKKHLNCTVNDYIINLRISHAKHMLAEGKSLTDACFMSGFTNYTYFISKFKSIVGTTPAKFKKEIL